MITYRPALSATEYSGETTGVVGKLSSISLKESKSPNIEPEVISRQGQTGKMYVYVIINTFIKL
jgi:hypothetical protein